MTTMHERAVLLERAHAARHPVELNDFVSFGAVAAALLTGSGALHVGVCLDTASSLGMCAEAAAVASMLTAGESDVVAVVAVGRDGIVLAPCGRCRELLSQLGSDPEVLLTEHEVVRLTELLPRDWKRGTGRSL